MLLRRILLACNISLRWSSCLWVTFRIYKHSAPPERKHLVTARWSAPWLGTSAFARHYGVALGLGFGWAVAPSIVKLLRTVSQAALAFFIARSGPKKVSTTSRCPISVQ